MFTQRYSLNTLEAPKDRVNEVHATPQELERLCADGFLVREKLFTGAALENLREGLETVLDEEKAKEGGLKIHTSGGFGGFFIRDLMARNPAFLELLRYQPTLSVVRAVMGPQIWVRDVVARVTYPGQPKQETMWHFHQRCVPKPLPPLFAFPHIVDALIYLDDLNDANGPLCVVPGSHKRIHEPVPENCFDELPGQVTLRIPAGSVVFLHGNLWHRAMATQPEGQRRRLLILGYAPPWMKQPYYQRPTPPHIKKLLAEGDWETKELLGASGFY